MVEKLGLTGSVAFTGPMKAREAFKLAKTVVIPSRAEAMPYIILETVAAQVSEFVEVNHNYEREHDFNLWFVVVAEDEAALATVLREIETRCGYPLLNLPLEREFFIDLGFDLQWT